MSTKIDQRKRAKRARADIGKKSRKRLSEIISDRLISSDIYKKAEHVMVYHSIGDEVMTDIIIDDCLGSKNLYLPRVDVKKMELDCCYVSDKSKLTLGAYDIKEPCKICKAVDSDILDIVIVPLVAFDEKCQRIGYGGGYYDRFLRDISVPKIGISFEQQKLDSINVDKNDVALDMVITDKKIYYR